jgi:hypothetical protein
VGERVVLRQIRDERAVTILRRTIQRVGCAIKVEPRHLEQKRVGSAAEAMSVPDEDGGIVNLQALPILQSQIDGQRIEAGYPWDHPHRAAQQYAGPAQSVADAVEQQRMPIGHVRNSWAPPHFLQHALPEPLVDGFPQLARPVQFAQVHDVAIHALQPPLAVVDVKDDAAAPQHSCCFRGQMPLDVDSQTD